MMEKDIEKNLVMEVKKLGGICPKFVSPGFDGMPDRMALFPGGKVAFIEVKANGKKPGALQRSRHRLLSRLGFKVYVLDSKESIKIITDEMGGDRK